MLRPQSHLNEAERRRHKAANVMQSLLLLGGMMAIAALCAWALFGTEGLLWGAIGGALALLLSPRVSPRVILPMYRARPITRRQLPDLVDVVERIAARAGLPRPPTLYYVPSSTLNAFAVGSPEESSIAVTDGMLRAMSLREMVGVLAHEISHIRNRDLWVMNLADTMSRLTATMAHIGFFLVFFTLPLSLAGEMRFPWLLILILWLAPTAGSLLQLALSRTREYDADLDAAALTGDPVALASALARIERRQGRVWEDLFMPGRRIPDPSLLRTHPPTEERIERLLALRPPSERRMEKASRPVLEVHNPFAPVAGRPRWRFTGHWY